MSRPSYIVCIDINTPMILTFSCMVETILLIILLCQVIPYLSEGFVGCGDWRVELVEATRACAFVAQN